MWRTEPAVVERRQKVLRTLFGVSLVARLLYPFFNSPLNHLFSDPMRHWENGGMLLHPGVMGSSDPLLYQVWIYVLRGISLDSPPAVSLGTGLLCAAMPYGWYKALRELQSRERALAGAIVIGLIPESISLYGYFMNETLLLSLLGYCFWATLRASRKKNVASYGLAAAFWLCAVFTRTVAVPAAVVCLGALWVTQSQKIRKLLVAAALLLALALPAGFHAAARLGFFSPFGNAYFNQIYSASGKREIAVSYGPLGDYHFGCPSFYNPTFYPWSDWTTDRSGVVSLAIDLTQGRAPWIAARRHAALDSDFPVWRRYWENLLFELFGQSWPNSDHATWLGWLTVWTRWVWAPLAVMVAAALMRGRYRGAAYLVPVCGLGTLLLLLMQNEAVMEARYREPVDALLVCAALTMRRRSGSGAVHVA